ncbi:hypothetical protein Ocin01_08442 [Orchesella cincta]|uniref:Uncharacterized protein n=1 Tax=Orchesella cincta TaxID=48709 RepID=A0A1D2MZ68_ORCCI|nr:hypothetical protein Ocin01_08442 [Orchesella cincta]
MTPTLKLGLRKEPSEPTPSPPRKAKKGRVLFSPAPKRQAPMKRKSAPASSTSAQSSKSQVSPASSSTSKPTVNLTIRRKLKGCSVKLEKLKASSQTNTPTPSSSVTDSEPTPKKRRRRRRRIITVLQTAAVNSKKPMSTLSNHDKYLKSLDGKTEKLMHETSCTSRRVLVLEQLEDEVVRRYVKLRSLTTKKVKIVSEEKGRIVSQMEDRINGLQQTIQTTKVGLTEEREALYGKTGDRICCYFCNSLSQSK